MTNALKYFENSKHSLRLQKQNFTDKIDLKGLFIICFLLKLYQLPHEE